MVLLNLCSNLYFPFLTYLANLKGLCAGASIPATPVITYPTTIIINTTLPVTTTVATTLSTTTTTTRPITVLCPVIPLACLTNSVSPIAGCPCIDPRQTNAGFSVVNGVLTALPQQNTNLFQTTPLGLNFGQFGTTILPQNQLAQAAGNPFFINGGNLLARDNNKQSTTAIQRSGSLQQENFTDPDGLVFASLGKRRRRKKRSTI